MFVPNCSHHQTLQTMKYKRECIKLPYRNWDVSFTIFISCCITGVVYIKTAGKTELVTVSTVVQWAVHCFIFSCVWFKEVFLGGRRCYRTWVGLSCQVVSRCIKLGWAVRLCPDVSVLKMGGSVRLCPVVSSWAEQSDCVQMYQVGLSSQVVSRCICAQDGLSYQVVSRCICAQDGRICQVVSRCIKLGWAVRLCPDVSVLKMADLSGCVQMCLCSSWADLSGCIRMYLCSSWADQSGCVRMYLCPSWAHLSGCVHMYLCSSWADLSGIM
jgi:uncharacterized membrane protein YagU involved in acid resistance